MLGVGLPGAAIVMLERDTMIQQTQNLRVLICEDEYLLASDLADELEERCVAVTGIMNRISDIKAALDTGELDANAAVLDVKLLDGDAFSVVPAMLARGMAVVFCTGYVAGDLPPEFSHLPTVNKPTDIDELMMALSRPVPLGAA
jgi:ActR/RegA family two-component response regulator